MTKIRGFKNLFPVILIAALFVVFLILGLNQIYHQDEYRWVALADGTATGNPHPPMTLLLLKATGLIFGYNHLRVLPAVFAVFNLILIYFISKKLSVNKLVALFAGFLFAFNVYSLIAGLQIDIDGAILPFFALASYNAYLRIGDNKKFWLPLLGLALVGGFLTKLSFVLFFGALIVDYYFSQKNKSSFKFKKIVFLAASGFGVFAFLAIAFYFFSPTHFLRVVSYAEHFNSFNFGSRAYLDLAFKIIKSLVFLSPLLFFSVFYALIKPDLRHKYRFWLIYLLINFVFYTIIFDFSTLTVERYFMFMIAPAAIIGAEILYQLLANLKNKKDYFSVVVAVVVFLALSGLILSFSHDVLPLNPKIAYFQHLKSLNLRFLIPFTGGSGPIGFYFSAMFIFCFWLIVLLGFIGCLFWPKKQKALLTIIVSAGLVYNALFIIEFLGGKFYGNVPALAKQTVDYVNANPQIKEVITYYDIGPYDLRQSGKYSSRFYTSPKRDYVPKLNTFHGHYMVVDYPSIDKGSLYWRLLNRCPVVKEFEDKKIHSYVFDCRNLKI